MANNISDKPIGTLTDEETAALLEQYRHQVDDVEIHGYSELLHHDYSNYGNYSNYSESSCCC